MVRRNDTTQGEDGERVSLPLIDEARPRRRPAVRGLVGVGKGIAWVVFALGAVVVSAWLHVFTPLARDVVRDVAVDAVNASIRGRIEVGRIDEIDFGRLGVSHVAVYDAEGRRVLQLEQARFEPDMASMLAGTIHFDSVQAEGGYVRLIETPEGPPSIATAFQAPETPDRAAESSGVVELDEIRVRRVRVTTTYEMARDLALADLHVTGELAFADGVFEAAVDSAGFTVERDGHVVGALESLSGSYDGADGGVAEGRARLRIGTGTVRLEGSAELPEEPGDPPRIVAEVNVEGVGPADLRGLGIDPAGLATEISGWVTFEGTPDTFELRANVQTDGGPVVADVSMRDGDRVDARVETPGLDASRVWAGVDVPHVSGTVVAEATGLSHPDDIEVSVRADDVVAGVWRLPSAILDAHVGADRVRIERLSLPYLRGDVDVRGTVRFDGSIDLHVDARVPNLRAEPNLRRLFPGIAGLLDADVYVLLRPMREGAPPAFDARGEATLRNARLGDLRAGLLRVAGSARGSATAPVVDATVRGSDVHVGDRVELATAELYVAGGPETYDVTGRVTGPRGEAASVHATARRLARGLEIDAQGVGQNIAGRSFGFVAEDVQVMGGGRIAIGRAELRSGDTTLEVRGTYDARRGSDLELQMDSVDVTFVAALLGLDGLEGRLEGELDFSGSPERPEIEAMLWYTGGTVRGVYVDDAALVLSLSTREGTLEAQLEVDLGVRGAAGADVRATFDAERGEPFLDALARGRFDARLESRDLALALLDDLLPDARPRLHGRVDGDVVARGTVRDPAVEWSLRGADLSYDGVDAVDAELAGSYAGEYLRATLIAEDEHGRIGDVELSAELDAPALVRDPSIAGRLADTQPWHVSMRTAARRLDELPRPLRADVPARVVLTAHVAHVPGEPLEADADAGITWLGERGPGAGADVASCVASGTARAGVRARLHDGVARVELVGRLGTRQVIGGTATAAAPVDDWLRDGMPETPPTVDARVELSEMELAQVPFVCRGATGWLSGEIRADGLFGDAPVIAAALRGEDIRYGVAPPSELDVQVELDGDEAVALVAMVDPRGDGLRADARVPLRWRGGFPSVAAAGALRARVELQRFHIEPLVAVPAIAFAEGTLDGEVEVVGTVQTPVFDGFVELHDVALGLVQPAQRFEDGSGRIVFHRDWIEIDRLHFHDLDGTIRTSGSIGLDGLRPGRARLAVYVDDLPVRSEGSPIGEITTQASVRATMTDERIEVWVRTRDMTIDVAREFRTSIQSLEPHPDIVIVRRGEPIDEPVDEAPQLVPVDVIVHMNAEEPFWVRREDFGVQLVSKLDIRSTGTDVRVGGYVEFRRGWLELLGKRFELEEGRVEFLGGSELDPRIDILMSHELETGGAQLFVRVLGHLQKPELQFSSTIPGVTTAGGVLALLAGGDRGTEGQGATESAAAQQATSFLAGVTAGMLTLTARREIGDVFPDISLEATDTGARLRAAFDADWLIPGFLEGIVRGMYIEGFVGTGGGDGAGAGQEGVRDTSGASGVGIELLFPHDLVGTAEIQPPASWSADLMYEP